MQNFAIHNFKFNYFKQMGVQNKSYLLFSKMFYRAWYVDGRVLVVAVTFLIILPLCLLKNLGKNKLPFLD